MVVEFPGIVNVIEPVPFSYVTGVSRDGKQWIVYTGSALEVLQTISDETFDCVITSPPYFWLRDYGVDGQIGLEETIVEYVEAISKIMDEVRRVLKSNGLLFLNLGDTYYSGKGQAKGVDRKSRKRRFGLRAVDKSGGMGIGLQPKSMIGIPWRIAISMISRGWALRSDIIWYQKYSLPESVKDRPKRSYEHIFMFSKARKYYFNRKPLVDEEQEDMWTIVARPKPTNSISTAPFPDELVEQCLKVGCKPNGSVLDPFAGAGTTLRVAVGSSRSATGIDLNPEFCEYIVNQLQDM